MSDASSKPVEGSVAPVEVKPVYKHPMVIITSTIAALPLVLAALVQFQQIPGLPTNITAWLAAGISAVTAAITVARALGLLGAPVVSPTAASKLIQSDAPKPN